MKNRYGVDVSYHTGKLNQIIRDMDNYTPDELARSLLRLANVADAEVFQEKEFTKPVKVKPLVWELVPREGRPSSRIAASNSILDIYIEYGPSSVDLIVLSVHCTTRAYPNLNIAKQAAQEHYEKLILASIE